MIALLDEIVRRRVSAFVSAAVIAQCWRGTPRQQPIAKLLHSKALRVESLDERAAREIGLYLRRAGTRDVVDGHVALLATKVQGTVFTSDPDDLRALGPSLSIVTV